MKIPITKISKTKKKPKQLILYSHQIEKIRQEAFDKRISESEAVRQMIDVYFNLRSETDAIRLVRAKATPTPISGRKIVKTGRNIGAKGEE